MGVTDRTYLTIEARAKHLIVFALTIRYVRPVTFSKVCIVRMAAGGVCRNV